MRNIGLVYNTQIYKLCNFNAGFGFELAHHLDAMGIVVFAGFYNSECPG